MTTLEILKKAKAVSLSGILSENQKNEALTEMANALIADTQVILAANDTDVENAKGKISEVMIDRLKLTKARIADMAKGICEVRDLPDYVGKVLDNNTLSNGLSVNKVSVPFGVVAII